MEFNLAEFPNDKLRVNLKCETCTDCNVQSSKDCNGNGNSVCGGCDCKYVSINGIQIR